MSGKSMDDLVALCKRRGFIYQASEIYGGLNGFWDYGPLGAQLKRNLADSWWAAMTLMPARGADGRPVSIVGLDSAIIQNPKVWEASGHVGGFNDPMVDDRETKGRFRADQLYFVSIIEQDGDHRWISDETAFLDFLDAPLDRPATTVVASSPTEAIEVCIREWKQLRKHVVDDPRQLQSGGYLVKSHSEKDPDRTTWWGVRSAWELGLRQKADKLPSPFSNHVGVLTPPRMFNLMFETYVGAIRDEDAKAYLRPETAQGIFINYKNVLDTTRVRVPFGIAQIGKAFRNEVTPRNFIFRSREFEQMEMEWFCHPSEAAEWVDFWKRERMAWWRSVGLSEGNLIFRQHDRDELSHYAKEGVGTVDIEYKWPFTDPGFGELEGIAHRTDFDLKQHAQHSGAKLEYFDQERNERYMPHVIEPAAGLTRGLLALLCEAYTPDPERASGVVMKFDPRMAPIKAAVYPLVNKDGMPEVAEKLHGELVKRFGRLGLIEYDPKQSIGKRYARMDEAGCPFCFTIDSETLSGQTVTVRDRDSLGQERIGIENVAGWLGERLG